MAIQIGINQLRVECVIGIYPQEKEKKQSLLIDLEVTPKNYAQKDDLAYSINYEILSKICLKVAKKQKWNLIESLANAILDECFKNLSILTASICITKPSAIQDAQGAYVKMYRENL